LKYASTFRQYALAGKPLLPITPQWIPLATDTCPRFVLKCASGNSAQNPDTCYKLTDGQLLQRVAILPGKPAPPSTPSSNALVQGISTITSKVASAARSVLGITNPTSIDFGALKGCQYVAFDNTANCQLKANAMKDATTGQVVTNEHKLVTCDFAEGPIGLSDLETLLCGLLPSHPLFKPISDVGKLVQAIKEKAAALEKELRGAVSTVKNVAQEAVTIAKSVGQEAVDSVKAAGSTLVNGATDAVNSVSNAASATKDAIAKKLSSMFGTDNRFATLRKALRRPQPLQPAAE